MTGPRGAGKASIRDLARSQNQSAGRNKRSRFAADAHRRQTKFIEECRGDLEVVLLFDRLSRELIPQPESLVGQSRHGNQDGK